MDLLGGEDFELRREGKELERNLELEVESGEGEGAVGAGGEGGIDLNLESFL